MTSSELQAAGEWIGDLLARLAPWRLELLVDAPIDEVTEKVLAGFPPPTSSAEFNQLIGTFIRGLHEEALRVKGPITLNEALAEGIVLLNLGQRGTASGYELALLSAVTGGDSASVIVRLAEVTKAKVRETLVNWTIDDAVAPLTWKARCHLVAGIVELNRNYLSADLCACPPAQMAPFIADLVRLVQHASATIDAVRPRGIVAGGGMDSTLTPLFVQKNEFQTTALSEETDVFETAET